MKKSSIFYCIKVHNFDSHWLFPVLLVLFFAASILKTQAQCPTLKASPSSSVMCSGTDISIELKSDIVGTTFSWIATTTNVAGATEGKGATISNILAASEAHSGSVVYTITPFANGCKGASANITVTVNPRPEITAVPLTSTIASGMASAIALTSNVSETEFSWTVTRSGVSGAAPGSGHSISQIISAVADKGIATYRITPNFKGCAGNPINAKVIVKKKS